MDTAHHRKGVEYLQHSTLAGSDIGFGLVTSTAGAETLRQLEQRIEKALGELRDPANPDLVHAGLLPEQQEILGAGFCHINTFTRDRHGRPYPSQTYYFVSHAEMQGSNALASLLVSMRTPEVRERPALAGLDPCPLLDVPMASDGSDQGLWQSMYQRLRNAEPCIVSAGSEVRQEPARILPLDEHPPAMAVVRFLSILPHPVAGLASVLVLRWLPSGLLPRANAETFTVILEPAPAGTRVNEVQDDPAFLRWSGGEGSGKNVDALPLPLEADDPMQVPDGWLHHFVQHRLRDADRRKAIADALARMEEELTRRRLNDPDGWKQEHPGPIVLDPLQDYGLDARSLNERHPHLLFRDAMLHLRWGNGSEVERLLSLSATLQDIPLQVKDPKLLEAVQVCLEQTLGQGHGEEKLIGEGPVLLGDEANSQLGHELAISVLGRWTKVPFGAVKDALVRTQQWLDRHGATAGWKVQETRELRDRLPGKLDNPLTRGQAVELLRVLAPNIPTSVIGPAAEPMEPEDVAGLLADLDGHESGNRLLEEWAHCFSERIGQGPLQVGELDRLLGLVRSTARRDQLVTDLCKAIEGRMDGMATEDVLAFCVSGNIRPSEAGRDLFLKLCDADKHTRQVLPRLGDMGPVASATSRVSLELPNKVIEPHLSDQGVLDKALDALTTGASPFRVSTDGWTLLMIGDLSKERPQGIIASLSRLERSSTPDRSGTATEALNNAIVKWTDLSSEHMARQDTGRLEAIMEKLMVIAERIGDAPWEVRTAITGAFDRAFLNAKAAMPENAFTEVCERLVQSTSRESSPATWLMHATLVMHLLEMAMRGSSLSYHKRSYQLRTLLRRNQRTS